jgi:hypothetical protein
MNRFLLPVLTLCISTAVSAPKKKLLDYSFNVYSQFGEDGIIKRILEIIGTTTKVAVEFGAWDGFYLSNTANLWGKDTSWKGILIEGDEKKFEELVRNTESCNCMALHEWVGIGESDSLEAILKKNNIKEPLDVLSIDIDGNDYHIFESLKNIRPRLIVCEYNPTIPANFDVFAPYGKENNFGCSVGALTKIAEKKGYCLVALTVTNAFFVLKNDFEKFKEYETDVRLITVNDGHIVVVTTYDGKYALIGNKKNNYFYGINSEYCGKIDGSYVRWSKK